ncbi:MAG: HNH endonuclease [Gammaproteobacteria bacterium]|nr:HNH endonuclease [Gammaproteobacteria bacterium]
MPQQHLSDKEVYEALGYLAHPYASMHYDVQVPPKKRDEFESTYRELTGEECCAPGPGSQGYSVLGAGVDKRSIQYRFSYSPVGSAPPLLDKLSTVRGAPAGKKRISNKALVHAMLKSGFVFGAAPSREKILSKIDRIHHIRFEFGCTAASVGEEAMEFQAFEDGFSSILPEPAGAFSLFDESPGRTTSSRIGRSAAFRHHVLSAYHHQCCLCSDSLADTHGIRETEAAHIVPKRFHGSDDVRNGLALCRKHHWAYDRGLFGIETDYAVVIPAKVLAIPVNKSLAQYRGHPIQVPGTPALAPDSSALKWHRKHILSE